MEIPEEKLADLLAYLGGKLSDSKRRQIESELAGDAALREKMSHLKSLSDALLGEDYPELQTPSRELMKRVRAGVKRRTQEGDNKTGVATFDSKLLPLPSGVRPATVSTRQLKFDTDQLGLDISLYPVTSASYQLIGQLSGADKGTCLEIRMQSGRKKLKCATNEFHIFQLGRVPAGKSKLTVLEKTKIVMVVELEI